VTGIDERIMIIEADIARAVNAANKISEVDSMISSFTLNLDQFKQEIKNEATERMAGDGKLINELTKAHIANVEGHSRWKVTEQLLQEISAKVTRELDNKVSYHAWKAGHDDLVARMKAVEAVRLEMQVHRKRSELSLDLVTTRVQRIRSDVEMLEAAFEAKQAKATEESEADNAVLRRRFDECREEMCGPIETAKNVSELKQGVVDVKTIHRDLFLLLDKAARSPSPLARAKPGPWQPVASTEPREAQGSAT
jgi:hypothetical protein